METDIVIFSVVGAVAVGLYAAVTAFSKDAATKAGRRVANWFRIRFHFGRCPGAQSLEIIHALISDVRIIKDQVQPNGGASIKDAIVRLECVVGEIRAEVKHIRTSAELASDAAGALLWRSDAAGRVLWVSKAIKEQLGYVNDSAYLGWAWTNVVHAADRDRVRVKWEQSVEDQAESVDEYRVISKGGMIYHVVAFAKPVFVDGAIDGWQGSQRITKIEQPRVL